MKHLPVRPARAKIARAETTLSATPVPGAAAGYSVDFSVARPGKTVSGVGQAFLVPEIVGGRRLIRSEGRKTFERRWSPGSAQAARAQ